MTRIQKRLYECEECGNQVVVETNHTGHCYSVCKGKCRQIINPHTAREIVLPKQTSHKFVGEAQEIA